MIQSIKSAFVGATVASFLLAAPLQAGGKGGATFTPLGDLPGGSFASYARSVSDDGTIVVGESADSQLSEAGFRWTQDTGMVALLPPAGWPNLSNCMRMSGDGKVICGFGLNTQGRGGEWAALYWNSDLEALGFDDAFEFSSAFAAASYDGTVFVGADRWWVDIADPAQNSGLAFRYTIGGPIDRLPDLPGNYGFFDNCAANDVTSNGLIPVGYATDWSGTVAVRWIDYGSGYWPEILPPLPNYYGMCQATATSHNGEFIVGNCLTDVGTEPFLFRAQFLETISLGVPPKDLPSGKPGAVSADGKTVVGGWGWGLFPWYEANGEAFIWTESEGMRPLQDVLVNEYGLDLTGWHLNYASDMTPDARVIIGTGFNPDGNLEAWVVTLHPLHSGDITGDGVVDVDDLLAVINSWGDCPFPPEQCLGDIAPVPAGNGTVDVDDLLLVINNWG